MSLNCIRYSVLESVIVFSSKYLSKTLHLIEGNKSSSYCMIDFK